MVLLLWICTHSAIGQLRPGGLAEPEEQQLLCNFQSAIHTEVMNVHLYFTFSLEPGNSNIKSCVTPAALILFGLFLFLHKCFTSLLL